MSTPTFQDAFLRDFRAAVGAPLKPGATVASEAKDARAKTSLRRANRLIKRPQ